MQRSLLVAALLASACGKSKDAADDYVRRSKLIEAKLQLGRLSKWAKVEYIERDAFPAGTVGPTPATPCCKHDKGVCVPDPATWQDPVWRALDFTIDDPFRFQYSYTSDGKTFTATAIGDVQCDGQPVTLTVRGGLDQAGEPVIDDSEIRATPRAR